MIVFLLPTQTALVRGSALGKAAEQCYCEVVFLLILELLLLCAVPFGSHKPLAPALLVSTWSFAKVRKIGRVYSSQSLPSMKR